MSFVDFEGRPLRVGQTVLKPLVDRGRTGARLERRTIERIEGGKVYLSPGRFSSRSAPLQHPERLYVIAEPETSE